LEIEKRYQVKILEIGTDKDHVHFLVQSVPTYSVKKIKTMIKSLTAREILKSCPQVKRSCGMVSFGLTDILGVQWVNMETKIALGNTLKSKGLSTESCIKIVN